MYTVIDLSADPRPSRLVERPTLGVEVTDPELASACALGNIDPQHAPGAARDDRCAALAATGWALPPAGAALATLRPDLDSIAAMAVLDLRARGIAPDDAMFERINLIDRRDAFRMGAWPGQKPLPRTPDDVSDAEGGGELRAVAAAAGDRSLPLKDRIGLISGWLTTGVALETYDRAADARVRRQLRSLSLGATRIERAAGGDVAIVISLEAGALSFGYRLAPVVVAKNPAFPFPGGAVGAKYTIARYAPQHADLDAAAEALNRIEPGWGGQAGIKGSPQRRGSGLGLDRVVEIVAKSLPQNQRG